MGYLTKKSKKEKVPEGTIACLIFFAARHFALHLATETGF